MSSLDSAPSHIITVQRGSHTFHVLDSPQTASWNFWDLFIAQWETTTLSCIDRHLRHGGLLFDIGAWVGPVSLWAAAACSARVIALEPDPVAFVQLRENISRNGLAPQITAQQVAVSNRDGEELLYGGKGDTRSSLTLLKGKRQRVVSRTLTSLMGEYGKPDLIKMDIEGGESLVLPVEGPMLRRAGIPLILSLHAQWYKPGTGEAVEDELSHWRMSDLGNEVYYCTPRSRA